MRRLAFLAAVILLVSAVSPAMAQTLLSVAIWGEQTRIDRTTEALSLFEQENAGVSCELRPFGWSDYWSMMDSHALGGGLPDVIQMDYQYLNQYVEDGLLLDLQPFVSAGLISVGDVSMDILDSGMVDGGLYGVCLGVNAPALFYNKTLLDSVGLTVPDYMTMDDFIALSREVYARTGCKTNIGYATEQLLGYYLRGLGSSLFDQGQFSASLEDVTGFFMLYEQGIREGWHVGSEVFTDVSAGNVAEDPLVRGLDPSGSSWCAFLWSNQMSALQSAADQWGMELGITTWPSPDPKLSNFLKPSQFFSVSAASAHPENAARLLDFFLNSVPANELLLGERGIPASHIVSSAISPMMDECSGSPST